MRIHCPCCHKEYRFSGSKAPSAFSCQQCGNVIPPTVEIVKAAPPKTRPSNKTMAFWLGIGLLIAMPLCVLVVLSVLAPNKTKTVAIPEVQVDESLEDTANETPPAKPDREKDQTGEFAETATKATVSTTSNADIRRQQLVEKLEKGVLLLKVDCGEHGKLGSGFLTELAGRRVVLTNFHVVEGARRIIAEFHDGKLGNVRGFYVAIPEMDLCVLDIQVPAGDRMVLPLLKTEPPKAAEVLALGSPSGLGFSVTLGIVSGLRSRSDLRGLGRESDAGAQHRLWSSKTARWVQTSAPISPGNSGGPLVDMNGQVVGMNTFLLHAADTQNLNFALSTMSILQEVMSLPGSVRMLDKLPPPSRQKE